MRRVIHWATIAIGVLGLVIALIGTLAQKYPLALAAILVAIVAMEFRVRSGFRMDRGVLFGVHIAAGIPLLLVLVLLIATPHIFWLGALADLLVVVIAATGLVLLQRHIVAFSGAGGETRSSARSSPSLLSPPDHARAVPRARGSRDARFLVAPRQKR